MDFKLLHEHEEGCRAVFYTKDGSWKNPWFIPGEVVWLDSIGRKTRHAHTMWFVVKCNSTSCKARGIVKHEYLCNKVNDLQHLPGES